MIDTFRNPISLPFVVVIFEGELSDNEIAKQFSLTGTKQSRFTGPSRMQLPEVSIAEGPNWKAIGDWSYSLWHDARTRPALWHLAQRFRILAFSIGDTDDSYSFHLFENGDLVRELVVVDQFGGGAQEVLIDHGQKMEGETNELYNGEVLYTSVSRVAKLNGFDPLSTMHVSQWTTSDPRSRSEIALAEESTLRNSWEIYRHS